MLQNMHLSYPKGLIQCKMVPVSGAISNSNESRITIGCKFCSFSFMSSEYLMWKCIHNRYTYFDFEKKVACYNKLETYHQTRDSINK